MRTSAKSKLPDENHCHTTKAAAQRKAFRTLNKITTVAVF